MTDNINSYSTLGWILNASEDGFFTLVATTKMQEEVLSHYRRANIAVYDCKQQKEGYNYTNIAQIIDTYPNTKAHFFLNFQEILVQEEDIRRLNISRDDLRRKKKILFFV